MLLNLKRKINIEGQHVYCFSHVEDSTTNRNYCLRSIKLNWLPMTPFLVYMHAKRLTFGKPFVRKEYNVLVIFNRFCEKRGSADRIPSEDCY